MNCDIIRDLLPSYIDELTSEKSNEIIEIHLKQCEECKQYLEDMKKEIDNQEATIDKDIQPFIKIKKDLIRKIASAVILTVIVGMFVYDGWYGYYYGGKSVTSDEVDIKLEENDGIQFLVFEPKDEDILISVGYTENEEVEGNMPTETLSLIKRNKHPKINPVGDNQYMFVFKDENTMLDLFANPHERDYTNDDFFAIGFDDCTKIIKLSDLREGKLIVTEVENVK